MVVADPFGGAVYYIDERSPFSSYAGTAYPIPLTDEIIFYYDFCGVNETSILANHKRLYILQWRSNYIKTGDMAVPNLFKQWVQRDPRRSQMFSECRSLGGFILTAYILSQHKPDWLIRDAQFNLASDSSLKNLISSIIDVELLAIANRLHWRYPAYTFDVGRKLLEWKRNPIPVLQQYNAFPTDDDL